jgi:hypothetical protein
LFKTVGAVENIGYHEPGLQDDDEKKRFKWWSIMLLISLVVDD